MTKVTVVIPTYNCAAHISEAIESALAQDFPDLEIIVVDDGSTDNTRDVLLKYSDRIRYFYQENKGVSSARNLAIRQAKGKYIAFLDSDDKWLKDKLSVQVKLIDKYETAAIVFTDGTYSDDGLGGANQSLMRPDPETALNERFEQEILKMAHNDGSVLEMTYHDFLVRNRVFTSSLIARKSCIDSAGGFNEKLKCANDYDMWLRLMHKNKGIYLNKVTARYRIRTEALSGSREFRFFHYSEWSGHVLRINLGLFNENERRVLKKRIVDFYNQAAWGHLSRNNLSKVRQLSAYSLRFRLFQPKAMIYLLISFLPVNLVRFLKNSKAKAGRLKQA